MPVPRGRRNRLPEKGRVPLPRTRARATPAGCAWAGVSDGVKLNCWGVCPGFLRSSGRPCPRFRRGKERIPTGVPLYEYQCKKCGFRFEKLQKFSDPPPAKCPECGGKITQLL